MTTRFGPPIWRAAVAQMRMAAWLSVPGKGHIAPLLIEPELVASTISEFWSAPTEYINARLTA
ncbi:MAG: hypothetical protein WA317_03825 [Mycobacterium sp.]